MKCLIVDDEQLARDILEKYVLRIPNMEVVAKCKNTNQINHHIDNNNIDLLFLDIHMPGMSGVEFLRQLNLPIKVVFTTAYSNYAVEGFELQVIDYLLKPIGFDRFEKAVLKAQELLRKEQKIKKFEDEQELKHQHILVKEGYDHYKIFLHDIIYIQAMKEYVQYHTIHRKILQLKSLTKVYESLHNKMFLKVHRSYIIQKSKVIGHKNKKIILQGGIQVPIGKTYKQQVLIELFPRDK